MATLPSRGNQLASVPESFGGPAPRLAAVPSRGNQLASLAVGASATGATGKLHWPRCRRAAISWRRCRRASKGWRQCKLLCRRAAITAAGNAFITAASTLPLLGGEGHAPQPPRSSEQPMHAGASAVQIHGALLLPLPRCCHRCQHCWRRQGALPRRAQEQEQPAALRRINSILTTNSGHMEISYQHEAFASCSSSSSS
jgi:hypothetical protein